MKTIGSPFGSYLIVSVEVKSGSFLIPSVDMYLVSFVALNSAVPGSGIGGIGISFISAFGSGGGESELLLAVSPQVLFVFCCWRFLARRFLNQTCKMGGLD